MNAGASGEEIKDFLIKVRYLDLHDMVVKEILRKDMEFAYRDSFFQRDTNKIVLKAWLKLRKADSQLIQEKMENNKRARWDKQPKDLPNAGSVFKRPEGYFVGAMIDELGLKGFAIGGAKVSEKHSGFIVNFDGAKGEDILNLIKEIKSKVFQKFGVELEVEQRVI
jgi:UDP-N-acetylmuramate dehydrogenase